MATRREIRVAVALSAAALLVVLLVAPLIGSAEVDYRRAWNGLSPDKEILFYARTPRVLLAALAGGALATAGVLFQALLRESLADPYTLGVSSGASLGAVLAICFGWQSAAGLPAVWIAALIGAASTLLLVMGIASRAGRVSSFTLLLAGITVNSIAIAVILFLQNLAGFAQSFAIVRWLMGGIETVEYSTLAALAAIIAPLEFILFRYARQWNLIAVGEEWAAARGISAQRLLWLGFVLGSVLTGAVTAITGPIGFLGLIVPHALRLKLGADHRALLPCSFLLGGAFLAVCDTISRTALAPAETPVGVITALCGGPFFIWLLGSRRRSMWR
jgi:iron complex transport system permease protein